MGLKSASKYKKEEGTLGGGVGEHITISKVKKGGVAWGATWCYCCVGRWGGAG